MPTFSPTALPNTPRYTDGGCPKIVNSVSPFKPTDIKVILRVFFQRQNANGLLDNNNLLHKSINIANTEELLGKLKEEVKQLAEKQTNDRSGHGFYKKRFYLH